MPAGNIRASKVLFGQWNKTAWNATTKKEVQNNMNRTESKVLWQENHTEKPSNNESVGSDNAFIKTLQL